jgi:hypothetical protein
MVFFIWRHLDAFIALQDYLDSCPPPPRPSYTEVTSAKAIDRFPNAYRDNDDIMKVMKDNKVKKGRNNTIGLWPLDVHSCFDWRDVGKNSKKALGEFIQLAKIESSVVAKYRASLFKNCPSAAFIRTEIATQLAVSCKIRPWSSVNPATQKKEMRQTRLFKFADKLIIDLTPPQAARYVNVRELKSKRVRTNKSQALVVEAAAALKRLEGLKAVASFPNSKEMDATISKSVADLNKVTTFPSFFALFSYYLPFLFQLIRENIARLVRMEEAAEQDSEAEMNPLLESYQVEAQDWPLIHYPRRKVFRPPLIRKPSKHSVDDVDDLSSEDDVSPPPPRQASRKTSEAPIKTPSRATSTARTTGQALNPPKSNTFDLAPSSTLQSISESQETFPYSQDMPKSSTFDFGDFREQFDSTNEDVQTGEEDDTPLDSSQVAGPSRLRSRCMSIPLILFYSLLLIFLSISSFKSPPRMCLPHLPHLPLVVCRLSCPIIFTKSLFYSS